MHTIDKIDKFIIEKLIENGRVSFAHIAKEINLTDVAIKKRLDRLKQRGIIKSISADINYNIIGFNEKIELLIGLDPSKKNNVIKKLKENEEIILIKEVIGEYNLIINVIAIDKDDLKDVLNSIFNIDGISKLNILTILEEHKNSKSLPNKIMQTSF